MESLLKEDEAKLIETKIRDPNTGILSKYKGVEYLKSTEIIDWLSANLNITRSKAVEYGQLMWDRGLFEIIGLPFGDNDQLFFVKPNQAQPTAAAINSGMTDSQWGTLKGDANNKDMSQANPIYKLHKSIEKATKVYQSLLKEKKQSTPPNTHLGLKLLDLCLNLIMSNSKPNPQYYAVLGMLQDFSTLACNEEDNAYLNPLPQQNYIVDLSNTIQTNNNNVIQQQQQNFSLEYDELLLNTDKLEKNLADQLKLVTQQNATLKKLILASKSNGGAQAGNSKSPSGMSVSDKPTTIYPSGFDDYTSISLQRQRSSSQFGSLRGIDLAPVVIGSVQNQFPKFLIVDPKNDSFISTINGPHQDALESQHHSCYNNNFYAKTVSTYPHLPNHPKREGDPICDHFCVQIQSSRVIAAVADGCNWGTRPAEAATRASISFVDFMSKALSSEIQTVQDAGNHILSAFNYAHNRIVEGKSDIWEAGTTTLLGGVLVELQQPENKETYLSRSVVAPGSGASKTLKDPNTPPSKWGFICASVGDCKAFHYSASSKKFTDITKNNRGNVDDPKDPGGRLGPYVANGQPDLRNLCLHFLPCNENDIIILISDGVHDNLDPQTIGCTPKELQLPYEQWSDMEPEKAQDAKTKYTQEFLKMKLRSFDNGEQDPITAKIITEKLVEHCVDTTKSSRDFMVNFPNKPLPDNLKEYKGKMDHVTCVAFKVGKQTF
ncbi:hypothetical protein CYY_000688 [Polysphondylium violaceum]|uniref:PPM-type phosphatase domain-containing protein n=1 Tax=Polysphondylium violaceum TaxID=133409 RepID=A0A8J4Q2F7_9MYCE|nr:hypothetical protein CYY_000688 [Polysphondylium violaceum]